MLIEFSLANYRSFGDKQTLCLLPAPKQKDFVDNIIVEDNHSALNAIALYGSNASGKSNLLKSIGVMESIIRNSARISSTTKLPYDPFTLKEGYTNKPTEMEMVFVVDNKRYRYGFSYTQTNIVSEWLYRKNIGREVPIFLREHDAIDVRASFQGSKKLIDTAIEATRDNALFLSQCDVLNVEEAKNIISWFNTIQVINGLNTEKHESTTVELWQQQDYHDKINQYLNMISLDIQKIDIAVKEIEEKNLPPDLPSTIREKLIGAKQYNVKSLHQMYSKDNHPTKTPILWDFDNHESEGSKKAFQLTGPILKALINGEILIIDEIDAKLHPIMTLNIIDMFLDSSCNLKHAQLIFATHDTNLLSYARLRRDQIYFAEKNKWESTEMFSLADFVYFGERNGKTVEEKERKDSDKERRYMEGRYGAIPLLGEFKEQITNLLWQKEGK